LSVSLLPVFASRDRQEFVFRFGISVFLWFGLEVGLLLLHQLLTFVVKAKIVQNGRLRLEGGENAKHLASRL